VLFAFVFAQAVIGGVLYALGVEVAADDLNAKRAGVLIAIEAALLVAAWAMVPAVGGWKGLAIRDARARFGAGMLMLAPIFVFGIVLSVLVTALAGDDPVINPDLDLKTGAVFVGLAIIIGWAEEVWFRGVLIAGLGGERRPWLTIFGSAVLFALPHFALDPSRATFSNTMGVLLIVGIPFAVVRLLTHTLLPLVICHAAVDAWAFLHTADISPSGSPSNSEIIASLVLPSLIAAGYVVAFKLSAHRRTTPPAP